MAPVQLGVHVTDLVKYTYQSTKTLAGINTVFNGEHYWETCNFLWTKNVQEAELLFIFWVSGQSAKQAHELTTLHEMQWASIANDLNITTIISTWLLCQ